MNVKVKWREAGGEWFVVDQESMEIHGKATKMGETWVAECAPNLCLQFFTLNGAMKRVREELDAPIGISYEWVL